MKDSHLIRYLITLWKTNFLQSVNQASYLLPRVFLSFFPLLMKFKKASIVTLQQMQVVGIFLDISKSFDKVLHKGLIFKLQSYVIEDNILILLRNYLENRKQE